MKRKGNALIITYLILSVVFFVASILMSIYMNERCVDGFFLDKAFYIFEALLIITLSRRFTENKNIWCKIATAVVSGLIIMLISFFTNNLIKYLGWEYNFLFNWGYGHFLFENMHFPYAWSYIKLFLCSCFVYAVFPVFVKVKDSIKKYFECYDEE